jgi:hypothetical protein
MERNKKEKILTTIQWVGFVSIVLFMLLAHHDRGNALSGKVENGLYYVKNGIYYNRVSKAVFTGNLVVGYIVILTFPPAFFAAWLLDKMKREDEKDSVPSRTTTG